MRRIIAAWVFVGLLAGCSDKGGASGGKATGGKGDAGASGESGTSSGGDAGSGTSGGSGGKGGSAGKAGAAGTATGGAGEGGADTGGSGGGEPVPLPPGSRELDGIVNLVDAAAAAELETYLTAETSVFLTRREDMVLSFNLFVEHYLEQYDFVFFYTDHTVTNAFAAGIFQAMNSHPVPGGSSEFEIELGGFETNGRTKGTIAINYVPGVYGPLAHELSHFWANNLDQRFGFGVGLTEDFGAHWGYASVNGQLGGFDGATLRCETPANGMPPCTALASGRTRYVVGDFAPFTNTYREVPYAPLELYLMGLAPASEVQATFQVLIDGETITPATQLGGTDLLEAAGIDSVAFSEITARHGQKPLLPTSERAFSAAFVVISATPASDATLHEIASHAAAFGNRDTAAGTSFETHTGGRATLDTLLGPRRDTMTPAPAPRELFECDAVAQDCARPELGCYIWPPSFCALSGNVALDEPCDAPFACAPGLDCVASNADPTHFVCKPYCDSTTTTAANSCQVLCPGRFTEYRTTAGDVIGALCFPQ